MIKQIGFTILVSIISLAPVKGQLGFAVAKCKIGSSLDYALVFNQGYETEYEAKRNLKEKGFKRVYNLNGGTQRGHNLEKGFYVVIRAKRKNYRGKEIVSYGLGASAKHHAEAEQRAISNLQQYDWAWKKAHGFTIVEQGQF